MFWVYILQCRDNSYYTGHTDNLEARLYQHYNRIFPTCYTAVNGYVKARINGAGFDPLIAAGASKVGLGTRASMHAWF